MNIIIINDNNYDLNSVENIALELIKENPKITSEQLSKKLKVTTRHVARILDKLKEE